MSCVVDFEVDVVVVDGVDVTEVVVEVGWLVGATTSLYFLLPLRKFNTSSLSILPFGPVPCNLCKSIEFSRAIFLTAGVVSTRPSECLVFWWVTDDEVDDVEVAVEVGGCEEAVSEVVEVESSSDLISTKAAPT